MDCLLSFVIIILALYTFLVWICHIDAISAVMEENKRLKQRVKQLEKQIPSGKW